MISLNKRIIVQDNFFKKDIFNKIKEEISNSSFTNRYTHHQNSVYQQIYFQIHLEDEHYAVKEVVKNLKEFNIDVKKINSNYFLSTKHEKPTPHSDYDTKVNCLIYLKGENIVNNGTGFYDKINNIYQLNCHIGFKENRAIIFDSSLVHSSLQFDKECGARYVMANFINRNKEYKDERKNS